MNSRDGKPSRMKVWGDSLLNQLPGISRKRSKRHASKIRRQRSQQELRQQTHER